MISYLTAATQPLGTHNILHCVITLVSSLFKPVNMRSCNFRNGETCSLLELDTKLIPVLLFFTATIAGQMNYWSIKNKTK